MKIVALDPGGTTGWCELEDGYFSHAQLGPKPHHLELWNRLLATEPSVVVCETFKYYPGQTHTVLVSVEYIGVAHLYCQVSGAPLVFQSPSQAKKFWTNDKLKSLGLFIPGKVHSMDATRHLLYYVTMTLKDNRYILKLRA